MRRRSSISVEVRLLSGQLAGARVRQALQEGQEKRQKLPLPHPESRIRMIS